MANEKTTITGFGAGQGAQGALALSTLLSSLGVSIANAALPSIAVAFGATFSEARWVVVAYLLAITVTILFAGGLGDLMGRRRMLLWGLVTFIAASFLCGLAPSLEFLIFARAIQGIGGAVSIALAQALVTDSVSAYRLGRTIGLLGTMSAVGTALGPSLSGFLVDGAGWRAIFFVLVPIGAVALLLSHRYLPQASKESSRLGSFDVREVLLLKLRTLFESSLRRSLAMNAIVSTVMMATLVVGPFYLSEALALSQSQVGMVMSVGPCLSILSGFLAGRLVDYFGPRMMVLMGLAQMTIGATCLALLPPIFGVAGYLLSLALLSPGYQMFLAANGTAVMLGADSEARGLISGALNLSRNLGLIIGASAMGAIFSAATGATAGLRSTFLVAALLVLAAIVLELTRGKEITKNHFRIKSGAKAS